MKKLFSLFNGRSAIVLLAAVLFPVFENLAQCPATFTYSNLKLNNQNTDVMTVQPNTTVSVAFNYTITNQTTCPGCISQVVIGLGGVPSACLYDGSPNVCPTGTSGNYSTNFTAPSSPGIYKVNFKHVQEFTCDDAKSKFASGGRSQMATIIVCSAEDIVTNVSLNGGGNNVSVQGGATVNMSLNYQVSNDVAFPTAIKQVVYGLENTAIDCIYNGIPPTCPNTASGIYSTSFTAPVTPGNYAIYKNQHLQFNCNDAKNLFNTVNKQQIGIVTVLPPLGVSVTFKVNVADYVSSGAIVGSTGLRIAGNFLMLGAKNGADPMTDWTPTSSTGAMTRISDDIWQVTISYPDSSKGKIQQFKFVNGDWGTGNQETSQELVSCGSDDGFGAFNRVYLVPNSNQTVIYCWDRCSSTCNGGSLTGIEEEVSSGNNVSFQPNPAKDFGLVQFRTRLPETMEIQVLDMQGKLVRSISHNAVTGGDHAIQIPLSDLKNGVYALRVHSGNELNHVSRFVVSK
mgnify:FL=1